MAKKRFRGIKASFFMPSHRQCVPPDRVQIVFRLFTLPVPEALDFSVARQTILLIIAEGLDGNTKQ